MADDTLARLGARLRTLREAAGLNLGEAAARASFTKSHVSQVELGKGSPTVAALARMADAVGARVELVLGAGTPEPPPRRHPLDPLLAEIDPADAERLAAVAVAFRFLRAADKDLVVRLAERLAGRK